MLTKNLSRKIVILAVILLLFFFYTEGISHNPPGFYVDEAGFGYNAYLVSQTGAGEFGPRFPIYFQFFTEGFTQYVNPTQVYLLALAFLMFPPSILVARIFAAFWMFAGCLLLGLLAMRMSERLDGPGADRHRLFVGCIVAASALSTPWLFETGRLVFEAHFFPFAIVLFLLTLQCAQARQSWTWRQVLALSLTLTLLTYAYTSGRLLGPLFALGLLLFATNKRQLLGVIRTWLLYGATLIPILLFNRNHPGALSKRLYEISYIRPGVGLSEIVSKFVGRYLEDQSLTALLVTGDYHPRHHVQGSGGALLLATFIIAVSGLLFVIIKRRRDRWWLFLIYGLAISILPGTITNEPFHALRLIVYPVFLLLFMVPTLDWLLRPNEETDLKIASRGISRTARLSILAILLVLGIVQFFHFQTVFRRDGPKREFDFDVPYKAAYDAAVAQPTRPVYLEDGKWGPAYIHALWYATIEGRATTEFVHLTSGAKAPSGGVVISSEENCTNCQILKRSGVYLLYRTN